MYYVEKIYKIFLLLVLFSFNLSSQTATIVNGYPAIDLSALNPFGVILSSVEASARRTQMNEQIPSNSAYMAVGSSVSSGNGTWNAKMSIKFQVMHSNHSVGLTNWSYAYTQCKGYDGEGGTAGQWRLPTQRELSMIYILHPQLIGKGGITPFNADYYWSATESSETKAWIVSFGDGDTSNDFIKTTNGYVRCVRDLY